MDVETCGFVPPTKGYLPCRREAHHDGPCAHEISIFKREITIKVIKDPDAAPYQLDAYLVSAGFPEVSVNTSEDHVEEGIDFVKGAVICAYAEMVKHIPNIVTFEFIVKRDG